MRENVVLPYKGHELLWSKKALITNVPASNVTGILLYSKLQHVVLYSHLRYNYYGVQEPRWRGLPAFRKPATLALEVTVEIASSSLYFQGA